LFNSLKCCNYIRTDHWHLFFYVANTVKKIVANLKFLTMEIKLHQQNERNVFIHFKTCIKKGALLLLFLCMFQISSFAQITTGFELDGNATSAVPNPPDDWDKIYNNTSSAQVTTGIVSDLNNIFQGGGSKDDLDVNLWGWTTGSVPDKDDILHGGVALYNNCKLYFFADRYATNGSSNIGFWLFKNNISINPDGTFSGVHTVGDLLLVSEFVNGGGTSIIKAFKWVGSGGNSNGTLDSVPVNGVNSFAITNTSSASSPWPYTPKTGPVNQFGAGAFFEGGIDLCGLTGLDPCFTSFIIETRSSFAVDAVLKDFMNGAFTSMPQITLNGGTRCVDGAAITLTANVTGGIVPYGYLWSPGGSTSASITVSPSSTTTYTVTVTGSNGCSNTRTATVTVNPAINVNAGPDKILTCTNPTTTLDGSSTNAGAAFSWSASGGGNIVSGGSTATPTVNAAGTYVLTVTSSGCSAMDTVIVTANQTIPNVNAGPDQVLTCGVTQVTLNGSSSTGGVTFSWTATGGGAIFSGGSTATPTVQIPGTYILTVTNTVNGCSASDTAVVTQDINAPNVSAGIDKVLTCSVTSLQLSGSTTTGSTTYLWATGDGNIVSGGTTLTPTINAAGTYSLTVTNTINGCTAMDVAVVTLDDTVPNVNAGADKILNCTTVQINMSGSSTTAGAMFSWSATNGGNIVSGGILTTPLVDAAGTYILTVTDPVNGCTASDTALVTLDINTPNANAGIDKVLTCTTTSIALSGSSSTSGVTFSWTASAGGNITAGGTTATPTVDAAGTYVLTVTNPVNGCTAMDTVQVTLNNNVPNVNAGADMTLNCVTTSVILNGSSSTGGVTFSWTASAGGNIVSGGSTATPTVDAAGMYTLTVTNPVNGCTAMDSAMVMLNNTLPNVNAGADMVLTCTTTSVILNGSSSTSGVTFSWSANGGGNIVSGGSTATPTANTAGTYILTVTNPVNGCSAMDSASVTLDNNVPNIDAGADAILTCTVTSVSLIGSSSTAGATFSWVASGGGNIVSGAATATPTVNAAGVYTLTVTNPVNGCSVTDVAMVTMDNNPPDADAGADMWLTCSTASVVLNGSSTTAGVTFSWTASAGGNIVSGSGTATPTVDAAGVYILTVTDSSNGCTAIDAALVLINMNAPDVNAGIDTVLACGADTISIHGMSTDSVTFSWTTIGGNIVSGANTTSPLVDASGTYILTVTDIVNGCTASDTVIVGITTPPAVDLGADITAVFCAGSVMLDAGNPGMTYLWNTGETTQTINVSATGTYYVTVTNEDDCSASDTINITVNTQVVTVDLGNDTTFMNCHALTLDLDAGNPGATYVWSTTETTQMISVTTSGTYYVTVTDTVGCTGSDTINVTIINNNIDVDLGNDTVVCGCMPLSTGLPGLSTIWCSGQTYPTINVCTTGIYCVTVSNGTCQDSDTIRVIVLPDMIVNLGPDLGTISGSVTLDAANPGSLYLWSTGETTQSITVTTNGQYWVIVTNAGGCIEVDTINIGPVSITERAISGFNINAYPNPIVDKTFTLDFGVSETSDVEIKIMNVLGSVIYSENLKDFNGSYSKKISMDNAAAGIYFIDVRKGNERKVAKITLE
jgi:hypothetical protein